MSIVNIRAALETALAAITPSMPTAWENASFVPPATAYQQVYLMLAKPDNFERGSNYAEVGYLHVKLLYPKLVGSRDVALRCELIRSTFHRGATFVYGGIRVIITHTPEVVPGSTESDRFVVSVKIPFSSFIF